MNTVNISSLAHGNAYSGWLLSLSHHLGESRLPFKASETIKSFYNRLLSLRERDRKRKSERR